MVAMGLYPPLMRYSYRSFVSCGYGFVFNIKEYRIDFVRLLIQWIVVAFVTAGLIINSTSSPKTVNDAEGPPPFDPEELIEEAVERLRAELCGSTPTAEDLTAQTKTETATSLIDSQETILTELDLKECLHCSKEIKLEALKCRYCGSYIEQSEIDSLIKLRELFKRIWINLWKEYKKCPACSELIKLEAKKCKFCNEIFDNTLLTDVIKARFKYYYYPKVKGKYVPEKQCDNCRAHCVIHENCIFNDGSTADWCSNCGKLLLNE